MASKPDVILKPIGRTAKYDRNMRFFARVSMGYQEGGNYNHPTVTIFAGNLSDDMDWIGRSDRSVDVRFQQTWLVPGSDDSRYQKPHVRGFLRQKGRWSTAYGIKISEAPIEYSGLKLTRRVLDLLERARSVEFNRFRKMPDCDMLRLIVSLQRVGVEVHVYNQALVDLRNARHAQEVAA